MLVMIAVLFGVIAGLVAAVLVSGHGAQSAVFSGSGAFVATSLFVIKIESTLRLFELVGRMIGIGQSEPRGIQERKIGMPCGPVTKAAPANTLLCGATETGAASWPRASAPKRIETRKPISTSDLLVDAATFMFDPVGHLLLGDRYDPSSNVSRIQNARVTMWHIVGGCPYSPAGPR